MSIIKTVSKSIQGEFEDEVNSLLEDGFILSSSDCGFVNSESYDFCESWQAILIKTSTNKQKE